MSGVRCRISSKLTIASHVRYFDRACSRFYVTSNNCKTSAVRSRISSKLIFATRVGYFDHASCVRYFDHTRTMGFV